MKREDVLFYLDKCRVYLYFIKIDKEIIEDIDTSSFFELSEIKNVELSANLLFEKLNKYFNNIIFKPDLYILYNDVTACDIKVLYKKSLEFINYRNIHFIELSCLIQKFNNSDNIVFYDGDGYTIFKDKIKLKNIDYIDFTPIFIGAKPDNYFYYSGDNVIWNSFKTYFTNQ